MISLGGAIGTSLFLSSGIALGYAGPSVLVSYAIAAFFAVSLVLSLSEMAVMHPTAGSFGTYAETYLNPLAGFVVRYTYWFAQVVATGFEAVAAGIYMTWWFPGTPVWLWSLGFASIVLYVNSRSVGNFGRAEYWLAFIKVTAIVLFVILGATRIFGLGAPAVGFSNLYALPGGFFPHGFHGMWMAVILAMLSFVGRGSDRGDGGGGASSGKSHSGGTQDHDAPAVSVLCPGARRGGGDHSLDRDRRQRDGGRKPLRQDSVPHRHSACPRHHEFRHRERGAVRHEHQCLSLRANAVLLVAGQLCACFSGQAQPRRCAGDGDIVFRPVHLPGGVAGEIHPQGLCLSAGDRALSASPLCGC